MTTTDEWMGGRERVLAPNHWTVFFLLRGEPEPVRGANFQQLLLRAGSRASDCFPSSRSELELRMQPLVRLQLRARAAKRALPAPAPALL